MASSSRTHASTTVHFLVPEGSRLATKLPIVQEAGYRVHAHEELEALLDALNGRTGPVCVVADVDDPLDDGLAVLTGVQEFGVAIPVILLDGDTTISTVARVFKAGAVDYLVRPVPPDTLIAAVEEAADLAEAVQESGSLPAAMPGRLSSLTPKEREVMTLLMEGRSSKEISRELGISHRTVEIHRGRVMVKMQARNAAHLVRGMMGMRGGGGGAPHDNGMPIGAVPPLDGVGDGVRQPDPEGPEIAAQSKPVPDGEEAVD